MAVDQVDIYVRLLDEGVMVYRPVPAKSLGGDVYRMCTDIYGTINATKSQLDSEQWEFPPGSLVICRSQQLQEETKLVAIALSDKSEDDLKNI